MAIRTSEGGKAMRRHDQSFQHFLRLILPVLVVLGWGATAQASTGCELSHTGLTQSVAIPGTGRVMLIHLPLGTDAATPKPILFLFHGSTGTGADMLND
jgi:polyhydroxybutyrate depolymerase